MGSGKSTLGSYLAKKLDYKFIDTDTEIINEVGNLTKYFRSF